MTGPVFDYTNVSDRPSGWFVRGASKVLRGVRQVQDEVLPAAQAWHEQNLHALAGAPAEPLWVALGDSLTQGIGVGRDWVSNGWVGQTRAHLAAHSTAYRVVNLSVSGARIADVIDRQLPALFDLQTQGVRVTLVTVLIGSNDLVLRKHRDAMADGFTTLLGLLPPGSVVANLPNPREAAHAVDRVLRTADADGRITLADMRQSRTMNWRGKLAPDHFHPNTYGYAGIAQTFYEAITSRPR